MKNPQGRKTQITRERIIETAFEMTVENGIESVSSPTLAKRLKCSVQPIYYVFENMEELKVAITEKVIQKYNDYMLTGESPANMKTSDIFSWNNIQFAKKYPNLYKLLFMTEQKENCISKIDIVGDRETLLSLIKEDEDVCDEVATKLFVNMWAFTHGIATLLVTKTADFDNAQINEMLSDVTGGLLKQYK